MSPPLRQASFPLSLVVELSSFLFLYATEYAIRGWLDRVALSTLLEIRESAAAPLSALSIEHCRQYRGLRVVRALLRGAKLSSSLSPVEHELIGYGYGLVWNAPNALESV